MPVSHTWLEDYERRRTQRRKFSYAVVNGGPNHFDLFKVYEQGGSIHLAAFRTREQAVAFAHSLPPGKLVLL
jgi:hypothetical protein